MTRESADVSRSNSKTRDEHGQGSYTEALLGIVAHELRTPVSTVIGAAATLKRIGFEHPDAAAMLDSLLRGAKQVQRLLDELLDLDRLRAGIGVRRSVTDVPALLYRVLAEADTHGRHVSVVAERLVADVDAAKVERIVANLLDNAIKHTAEDTPIWIRATRRRSGLLITVEDAGPGLAPSLKKEAFAPYVHGPHSAGSGFGLQVVGQFAQAHGGRAWVQDRPGGGAVFHVFLPARTTTISPADEPALAAGRSSLG